MISILIIIFVIVVVGGLVWAAVKDEQDAAGQNKK